EFVYLYLAHPTYIYTLSLHDALPILIFRTSAEHNRVKSFASALYKLHLADVDRNQHRIRNSMSSPIVSVDSSLSRNFDPIDIARSEERRVGKECGCLMVMTDV